MENSRLIQVFNTFSKKEIRDLRKWLQSPAHNQREDVLLLFEYLAKNFDSPHPKALHKERAYAAVHPKAQYADAKMRQVMHFLLKSIEEFFIYRELRSDEVRAHTALSRVFRKRKLDKPFRAAIRAAKSAQKKTPYRNEHYLRNEFLLQLEEYAYVESKRRTVKMNIQEVANTLEVTFLADKLKYSCMMRAHQTVYKTDYDTGMLAAVLQYVENGDFFHVPAIAVYYHGYMVMSDRENPAHFKNLKREIMACQHEFPPGERRDIYLLAINYLIGRMNAGDNSAPRELFEFYKNGLEQKILLENQLLSRFTFMNVMTLALTLKEYTWVENFIQYYQRYLEEQYRDSIVHFCRSKLHFEKKDYGQAMQLLTQVEYDDILMNLYSKSMLIRMFYEKNELDALESLLESTRTYMQRKKVMGYHKANFTNLIRLTKKLLKTNPFNKSQVKALEAEVTAASPMATAEKQWLQQQVANL